MNPQFLLELIGYSIPQKPKSSVDADIADLKGIPLDEFFEKSYNQLIMRSPETLTELGMAESFGLRNDKMDDLSDGYVRETHKLEAAILDLLRTYERESLPPQQQLSYDVYEWFLECLVRGHQFMYYNYPVHQFLTGYHHRVIHFLTEIHPVTGTQDAEDYISRLSQLDRQINQVIEGLKLRKEMGVVPPKFIIEMTRKKMSTYLHLESSHSNNGNQISLYTFFEEKVNALDISEQEKTELLKAALKEVEHAFIPAYKRLLHYLEDLESTATEDAGVWKFPKGDEYYAYLLWKETSTELTPDEIHNIGLREVERIRKEIRAVFNELGYPEDVPFSELVTRVDEEAGVIDASTSEGKDEVVKTYETFLEDIDNRLEAVTDIRPRTKVIVYGDLTFGGGGGYYVSPSADGSRPGAFHTGVGGGTVHKYRMPAIAYHEAIPGHHFQIAIARELDLPFFRNDIGFNGFIEGWGMYAERLAWELGVYDDDPYGNIGRLELELLRAIRLVTDTGIHAKKWTREEGKAYIMEVLGIEAGAHEVDRYIVIPAQACGYKIGMLKILELRQKVKDSLGDQFDLKEFHDVVLGNGSVPLEILERLIDEYIEGKLQ